jgi:asparagine synthetase B (glutamine-hydrolysing)
MASFVYVTSTNGILQATGSKTYERCFDPVSDRGGVTSCSIAAGWQFDGKVLRLSSDRLGLVPIFIYQGSECIAASDDLSALLSLVGDAKLDYPALSVFVRLGYFIGNDTPFADVSVMPPATTIEWTGERKASGEAGDEHCGAFRGTREDAVAEYVRLFSASVAKRVSPEQHISLPLTGGRDSRHILFELVNAGKKPMETVTVRAPGVGHGEVELASLLARRFNIQHPNVEFDHDTWVERELEKNRITHCLSDEHAWYLTLDEAVSRDANIIFDGLGGDVLSNGLFFDSGLMKLMREGQLDHAARLLLPQLELKYLRRSARQKLSIEAAHARLVKELARHIGLPDPVKSYFFWNRTRREIALAPICIESRSRQISLPFVDRELFHFLMSLPGDEFGDPGFHDEAIERVSPVLISYASKRRDPLTRSEQIRMVRSAFAFLVLRGGLDKADLSFVLPRLARSAFMGVSADLWWMQRLIYFKSLEDCGGGHLEL